MPKLKTNKSALKRFKLAAAGKSYKHRSTNRNHILTKKTNSRKRNLRAARRVGDHDIQEVKRLINGS
jgi:large subunit ribosomal protein L35